MPENKQLAVVIARYVFPSMRSFSTGWVARIGSMEAHLAEDAAGARILVTDNGSPCWSIEVGGNRVEVSNGDETRCFKVNGLTAVPAVANKIRKFFEVR